MSEYGLYCFSISGNAYKAALMLQLTGCDWEPLFVDYMNGETRTGDYRALNEMGEAPVLVHGDLRLSQSGVILDYLAEQTGRFGPANASERREIMRWLLFDNHKFSSYFATHRFLKAFTPDADPAVLAFFAQRMNVVMAIVDKHLADRPFMLGNRLTIADISMVAYMYFDDEAGIDLEAAYPAIHGWRQRIAALPGWRHPYDLMPGHPPGKS